MRDSHLIALLSGGAAVVLAAGLGWVTLTGKPPQTVAEDTPAVQAPPARPAPAALVPPQIVAPVPAEQIADQDTAMRRAEVDLIEVPKPAKAPAIPAKPEFSDLEELRRMVSGLHNQEDGRFLMLVRRVYGLPPSTSVLEGQLVSSTRHPGGRVSESWVFRVFWDHGEAHTYHRKVMVSAEFDAGGMLLDEPTFTELPDHRGQ